jgi:N-acetylglucosaminyldiphosphoundecaprenol N-acetyl-beta-D-mannosaminyltransferase
MMDALPKKPVLGIGLSTGSFAEHIDRFARFGAEHRSSYVCCVNAHMCVEAHNDPSFGKVVNEADFATADGMPMLNRLKSIHGLQQERVAGNDIMPALMTEAARRNLSVYLYGGKAEILDLIIARAAQELPTLRIAGACSPPFRPLTAEETTATVQDINGSGAHIVLVSLGCPKQERWMAAMKGRVNAIMLGMGGAFLLYAGKDTRAPKWMRDLSLEWVYRFALEPGRLWKRYLVTNTQFVWLAVTERFRRRP